MEIKAFAPVWGLMIGAALLSAGTRAASAPRPGIDWPQFRGISAAGISEGKPTPTEWNVATGKNLVWKAAVPGLGLSSPVVWGDRLFVSAAISGKKDATIRPGLYGDIESVQDDTPHEWRVYCLNKKTGAIVWQRTAHTGVPKIKRHMKNSHANSTLATDGQRLVAFFGSEGVYAYDLTGKLLFLANEDGQVFVIKAGPKYELMALNEMGSSVLATPAISEGRLLFRTQRELIAIGLQ